MDPDVTLAEIRGLVVSYNGKTGLTGWQITELVEKFEALDEWISRGGFLPEAWGGVG